jgi:CDP-paratose 2-epimerase
MKVLVTGGCGFIGSHVCEFYRRRGDDVVSYDNMTKLELQRTQYAVDRARDYNWDYLKGLGVDMLKADVRNYDQVVEAAAGCDYIVHTAAQPAVTISMEDPELDLTTNVLGTFNVLKAARAYDIPVVSCATIHVYGNLINATLGEGETRYLRTPAAIDESHATLEGLLTPLHASKRSAEIYLQVFIDTYKVRAASFRLTGLYGPRQLGGEDHGWVANFSIRAMLGWPLNVYGTGKQVRDILYATDVAEAFHAFYERQVPGIYNIGGGSANAISLIECIDLIGELTGRRPDVTFNADRLGDLRYFVCDSSKAERLLGWRAKVRPRQGVGELVDWIGANLSMFRAEAEVVS